VIIRTVPGAGWHTAADGRPVVQLRSGAQVDVLGAARTGAVDPSTLTAIYQRARNYETGRLALSPCGFAKLAWSNPETAAGPYLRLSTEESLAGRLTYATPYLVRRRSLEVAPGVLPQRAMALASR
jgi:hypothetical protein